MEAEAPEEEGQQRRHDPVLVAELHQRRARRAGVGIDLAGAVPLDLEIDGDAGPRHLAAAAQVRRREGIAPPVGAGDDALAARLVEMEDLALHPLPLPARLAACQASNSSRRNLRNSGE